MEKTIKVTNAFDGLKEIVQTLKSMGTVAATGDPRTITFMIDGFIAKGMPIDDKSRMKLKTVTEVADLGFMKLYIDPEKTNQATKLVCKDSNDEEHEISIEFAIQF